MRGQPRSCLGDGSSVTLISGEVCWSRGGDEEPGECSFDPFALELFLVTGPLSGSSSLDSLSSNSSISDASCSSPNGVFVTSDWMQDCAPRVLYLSLPSASFTTFSSDGAAVDDAGFTGVSAEDESELLSEFSESLPELSESDSEKSTLGGGRSLLGETRTLSDSSLDECPSSISLLFLGEVVRRLLRVKGTPSRLAEINKSSASLADSDLRLPEAGMRASSPLELVVRRRRGSKLLRPRWNNFPRSILMTF